MTTLKLSCFGHIMGRQGSLEKTIMLHGSRKRGRTNMRWVDSVKQVVSMRVQELGRAAEDRHGGPRSFIRPPGVRADTTVCNAQHSQSYISFLQI